jgi:hypothetical protein
VFVDLFNNTAATVLVTSNEDGSWVVRQKVWEGCCRLLVFWDVTCQKISISSAKQILQTAVFTSSPLPPKRGEL